MKKTITVAVLGSTGYVGLELIYILSRHSGIKIIFLGSENFPNKDIRDFDKRITSDTLPKLDLYKNIDDYVFKMGSKIRNAKIFAHAKFS